MTAPTAADFRSWYSSMKIPPPASLPQWYKTRGLHFERALFHLFDGAGLQPQSAYRPKGEQIDGSFVLSGRVFLLEAKWHKDPLPVSAIYSFQGKVTGNLVGTVGVFVSMSGFARRAADALVKGKLINVILVDGSDMDICMDGKIGVKNVLEAKLRAAAEEGIVYWPSTSLIATAKAIKRRSLVKR